MSASLLDKMEDGNEFLSAIQYPLNHDAVKEDILKALNNLANIRKRNIVCYAANDLNPSIENNTIEQSDEAPFNNMLHQINDTNVDIAVMTPGGIVETVEDIVEFIQCKFSSVSFIVLHKAMSAGTILCLSGDELIMNEQARLGPIDPQVVSRYNMSLPIQTLQTVLKAHKKKKYDWLDENIIKTIDPKEVGMMCDISRRTFKLIKTYLTKSHLTKSDTPEQIIKTAKKLTNHSVWLSHGTHITRNIAENECALKITHPEQTNGLDRAIRQLDALLRVLFVQRNISKVYATQKDVVFLVETKNASPNTDTPKNNIPGSLQQWPYKPIYPQKLKAEGWRVKAR